MSGAASGVGKTISSTAGSIGRIVPTDNFRTAHTPVIGPLQAGKNAGGIFGRLSTAMQPVVGVPKLAMGYGQNQLGEVGDKLGLGGFKSIEVEQLRRDPQYQSFKDTTHSDGLSPFTDEYDQAFINWKARQADSASKYNEYVSLSKDQPGRDQTILTGPASKNTLLGGG